ncbi:Mrp family chromosome partitioning ATPase [Bradyrhizobium ottawaense]
MPATPVYIICSPRPQVGKTLLARLLAEFLLLKNGNVAAFDVNLKEPSLLDYLPKITETADVIDTYGKMQLMDRVIVDDGMAKVIDLGFHAFDEFFKMTDEIGLLKEAARPPCRASDPVRRRHRSRLRPRPRDAARADPADEPDHRGQ